MMKSQQLFLHFFWLVVIISTLYGCMVKIKTDKIDQNQQLSEEEGTLLFNGKNLEGWEITNFGPQGPVYVTNEKIILEMGDGCTGITWKRDFPLMDYEVNLEAMRINGNDFFCGMTFPVENSFCSLIIGGWGGLVVGISCIDGWDASENETTRLFKFNKNTWYQVHLRVASNKIIAWINDIRIVDFEIGNHNLSVRSEVELSEPFGIASWKTTAAIRKIRLKATDKSDHLER